MPNVTFTFDCTDRPIGFYADLEFDCMVRSWLSGYVRRFERDPPIRVLRHHLRLEDTSLDERSR